MAKLSSVLRSETRISLTVSLYLDIRKILELGRSMRLVIGNWTIMDANSNTQK